MIKWACFLSVFVAFTGISEAFEKKVRVERPFDYGKDSKGKTVIKRKSYLEGRPQWSVRLNFASSLIELVKDAGVDRDSTPFQVDILMHKNYRHFSIGPELGYMSSKFNNETNEISVAGFSLGMGLYLDGLFQSPYFVPFATVGGISLDAENETDAGSVDIETKTLTTYYKIGFLLGLNWLDRRSTTEALADYGLQNSYLYFAAKKISNAAENEAETLETDLFAEFGFQLEF